MPAAMLTSLLPVATMAAPTPPPPPSAWRLPEVDWAAGGHRLPVPHLPSATVRAVDAVVWPADNATYAYTDITSSSGVEVGVFRSQDGLSGWQYHGIAVHRNTSAADVREVGTPAALVKGERVFVYFKYTAANGTRGIGIAAADHPLGPFARLAPAAPAPEAFHRPYGPGGIFDDTQVFQHEGRLHLFHSRSVLPPDLAPRLSLTNSWRSANGPPTRQAASPTLRPAATTASSGWSPTTRPPGPDAASSLRRMIRGSGHATAPPRTRA